MLLDEHQLHNSNSLEDDLVQFERLYYYFFGIAGLIGFSLTIFQTFPFFPFFLPFYLAIVYTIFYLGLVAILPLFREQFVWWMAIIKGVGYLSIILFSSIFLLIFFGIAAAIFVFLGIEDYIEIISEEFTFLLYWFYCSKMAKEVHTISIKEYYKYQ